MRFSIFTLAIMFLSGAMQVAGSTIPGLVVRYPRRQHLINELMPVFLGYREREA